MRTLTAYLTILILTILILFVPAASLASPASKLGIVFGNKNYHPQVGALQNPHQDAAIVRNALLEAGFEVKEPLLESKRATMMREVSDFSRKLGALGSGAIGFLYYSGHGIARPQSNANYLIPTDVSSTYDSDIWWNTVSVDEIISEIKRNAPESVTFVVIDACRNELRVPIKSSDKGFTATSAPHGIFVAFSTSPNTSASDNGSSGGPYSNALALELRQPNQHHFDLFQNVKEKVYYSTGKIQLPWESNGIIGRVILNTTGSLPGLYARQYLPIGTILQDSMFTEVQPVSQNDLMKAEAPLRFSEHAKGSCLKTALTSGERLKWDHLALKCK